MQIIGGFGFHDQDIVDDHVEALGAERDTLVINTNCDFSAHAMTTRNKLTFHREYVHLFEKTKTEGVVHLEEGTDYGARQGFVNELDSSHGRSSRTDCSSP